MKTRINRETYPSPIMAGIACWFMACRSRYRIERPEAFKGRELVDRAGFTRFMLEMEGEL